MYTRTITRENSILCVEYRVLESYHEFERGRTFPPVKCSMKLTKNLATNTGYSFYCINLCFHPKLKSNWEVHPANTAT